MTATPKETGASAESAAPATPIKMTPRDWARCRELWARGEVTYKDLVAKYGRSYKSFERHFKKHKIVKGSKAKALAEKVTAAMEREQINDAQMIAERIRETKEEHYRMASGLARLSWNEILQAKKDGKPVSIATPNLKALNTAIANLKMCREERYAVLGLDKTDAMDPDTIPELVIRELTAEQVEQLRKRDHTEVEDGPVVQTTDPAIAPRDEDDDDEGIEDEGPDPDPDEIE